MNTIINIKRGISYISLLSCFTLSATEAQANNDLPSPEINTTNIASSNNDVTIISNQVIDIEESTGTAENPKKIQINHGELNIRPGVSFIGKIGGSCSEIKTSDTTFSGIIYLHKRQSENEPTNNKLDLKNTKMSSSFKDFAIKTEYSENTIENSTIFNSAGDGIVITTTNTADNTDFLDTRINNSTISTDNGFGIIIEKSDVFINNSVIRAGKRNEENIASIGIVTSDNNPRNDNTNEVNIKKSIIESYGNGIYMHGGNIDIDSSKIMARKDYAIMTHGGSLTLQKCSELKANDNAYGIYTLAGKQGIPNNINLDNSSISTEKNIAIVIDNSDNDNTTINNTNIMLANNSRIHSGNGTALISRENSIAYIKISDSHVYGGIDAYDHSILNINLDKGSLLYGHTKNVNVFYSQSNSLWKTTTNSDATHLYHAGNIELTSKHNKGIVLTIHDNYIGRNGTITFNTKRTGDSPFSDKLVIGGNSIGHTNIAINNIGGAGDKHLNGFELIHVDGSSDAIFNQSGRIVAGAYDYSLKRGQGNNAGNWYLTSQTQLNTPRARPTVRPEAAGYIANLSSANTLFITAINDSLTETQYTDFFTGKKKLTSLWLRQTGGHNNWHDNSGQLTTQANSYVTQLGGDIIRWSTNSGNQGHLGLMVGQGMSRSTTHSSITHYHSKSSVKGYSVGTYTRWHRNKADKSGPYVNSWLQYNWFNNHIQGQSLATERYQSKGINASLEAGYGIKMGNFTDSKKNDVPWFIQPQAQITWMNVKANKHRESNGSRIVGNGEGNIQTRLGIRLSLKGQHIMDKNKAREFEPFIEGNWLHNTRDFGVKMDGARVNQAGTRNIGEVKVGIAGKINSKVNVWGNIGTQIGDKGYNNTNAMFGIKYNF